MRAVAAALAVTTLAACSGSFFQSHEPQPRTYLLSVKAQPAPDAVGIPADVTMLMPRVRTGLETDHIVALYPDHRLDYFAAARWSGPLDEVMQDLTLQAFRGRIRNVHSDTSVFEPGYWLEVDVLDFQAEYATSAGGSAPTAHVHLLARVGDASDRRVLGEFQFDVRVPAADNHLTAVVAAYDEAVGEALGQIVVKVTETLARAPRTKPAPPLP
jgi:cholesterol transport system auxiliary component